VKETGAGDEAAAVALLIRSRMAADEVPVLVRALMRWAGGGPPVPERA
jgi:hypothetical protein